MAKIKSYRVEARSDEAFQVTVQTGEHILQVDQPLFAGGANAGATPIDHLFAALAGCVATTARIMAKQKKLNLNGMDISVEGSLDLDIIAGKSSDTRPGIAGITVTMSLDSDMSDREQAGFIEELQRRCPVYDTLAGATPIELAVV